MAFFKQLSCPFGWSGNIRQEFPSQKGKQLVSDLAGIKPEIIHRNCSPVFTVHCTINNKCQSHVFSVNPPLRNKLMGIKEVTSSVPSQQSCQFTTGNFMNIKDW